MATSRTMASATTAAPDAASPCKTRNALRASDVRGDGAQQRGHDVQAHADQQGPAATEAIRERTDQELTQREADQRPGQRQPDRRRRALQVSGDARQRRQVGVHRQRPEGGQRAQDDDQLDPDAGGHQLDRRAGRAGTHWATHGSASVIGTVRVSECMHVRQPDPATARKSLTEGVLTGHPCSARGAPSLLMWTTATRSRPS